MTLPTVNKQHLKGAWDLDVRLIFTDHINEKKMIRH